MKNWLETLIRYAGQLDPDLTNRLEGATQDEIKRLEALLGHGLPEVYAAFLARMGRDTSDLMGGTPVDTRIGSLLKLYETSEPAELPSGCIIIGDGFGQGLEGLALRVDGKHEIFHSDEEEIGSRFCANLPSLLWQHALSHHNAKRMNRRSKEGSMPHSTQGYLFECKILGFALGLSEKLTSERRPKSFVLVFDDSGAARHIQFDCPQGGWPVLVDQLVAAKTPYLFYDPFEPDEYTWLAWGGVEKSTMERLIGESFEQADFEKMKFATPRAQTLEPAEYPISWSVMF